MNQAASLSIMLFITATIATAGDMYKWKDLNGVTHYSENPPASKHQAFQSFIIAPAAPPIPQNPAKPASAQSQACQIAQHNLQLLNENSKVLIASDGDDKATIPLNDEQRAAQKELAQAAIKASCAPQHSTP